MHEQRPVGRVLVIDDQEATRYVFRRILTRAGYHVEEAGTGGDGLAKAATNTPDLIICDVNLPDMLGYDVSRRLKSNSLTRSIPLLQISASFFSEESKVQALAGGADSYLTQPVEPAFLLAQVSALLRLRKAEALSHLSALQWQTTFDALSDGLAVADSHGVIQRANPRLLESLNLVLSEVEGKFLSDIFEQRFGKPFAQFLEDSAGHPAELSSENRWFRIRYDQIQSEQPGPAGSVLIVTEITEHKKLQETLKLSERLASAGRLAHIMAHEINNPLEAMSNLLYLGLRSSKRDPETHGYLEQASAELVRISQITRQVLAYHRESKQPVLAAPNDLLEGVLTMFRTQMFGNGIHILTALRCSRSVFVHPGEIRQVFSNLLSNALDAIGKDRGTLRIRCFDSVDQRTNTPGVRFLFSDSGPGIPEQNIPRIFEAFYTSKGAKGSGMGLWLSSEVVAKHQGRMRVRTRTQGPYRGTLLDIFLPAAPSSSH